MSEEPWYKMLAVSFALHILVVAAFSIPFKSTKKRIDLSSSYSVNLVGGTGSGGGGQKQAAVEAKKIPEKSAPAAKEVKPVPAKSKPVPKKKEDLLSQSKKKVPEKKGTTEDERDQLEEKIRNLRKKTEYLDVAKAARSGTATSGGRSGSGLAGLGDSVGGGIVDPIMQKYHMDVLDKIKNAWRMPATAKKGLVTQLAVKIRRDGIVVEVIPVAMSGNRPYDESIMRAIRSAEPLPRIPSTIKEDAIELGFNFRPEDM